MKHKYGLAIAAVLLIGAWLSAFYVAARCDAAPLSATWYGPPQEGFAVHYGESWDWARIADKHGVVIPDEHVPVAHWDCSTLGRTALLQLGTGEHFIPCVVADCTYPEHVALVQDRDIVAEVPFEVAVEYGFVGGRIEASLYLEEQ
jgi:hypothetical protein